MRSIRPSIRRRRLAISRCIAAGLRGGEASSLAWPVDREVPTDTEQVESAEDAPCRRRGRCMTSTNTAPATAKRGPPRPSGHHPHLERQRRRAGAVSGSQGRGHLADQKACWWFRSRKPARRFSNSLLPQENSIPSTRIPCTMAWITTRSYLHLRVAQVISLTSTAVRTKTGAARYGDNNPVNFQFGREEFIGTTKEDGTDREQRDSARGVYEAYIERSPVPNASAIGRDISHTWGSPTGQPGY
jgi:hypothetical protein